MIEVAEQGLLLREIAPDWDVSEISSLTEPELIIDQNLKEMEL